MRLSGTLLSVFLFGWLPCADAATQTLRAGNADELINAFNIADRSGQPAIIRLATGHYVFTKVFHSAYGTSALPAVNTMIEIVGSDASRTILEVGNIPPIEQSADSYARFFTVLRRGRLSLSKITLQGAVSACIRPACANQGGGVADNVGGELQFHDSVLRNNSSFEIQGDFTAGGAIASWQGHLLVERSVITGNFTTGEGGAIAVEGGAADIHDSIISANQGHSRLITATSGAGVFVGKGSRMNLTGTTISGNSAGDEDGFDSVVSGLGLYNEGTVTIANSALTENFAINTSGGGGAIYNSGVITLQNTTISGNSVGSRGGGIYNLGKASLQGVTLTDNSISGVDSEFFPFTDSCGDHGTTPRVLCFGGGGVYNDRGGMLIVADTAIADNNSLASPDNGKDCHGILTSKGHNAVGVASGCTITSSTSLGGHASADITNIDAKLGLFQDNGDAGNGHHTPLPRSPLIDAGGRVGATCSDVDQLGSKRLAGSTNHAGTNICDIGAIEYQP